MFRYSVLVFCAFLLCFDNVYLDQVEVPHQHNETSVSPKTESFELKKEQPPNTANVSTTEKSISATPTTSSPVNKTELIDSTKPPSITTSSSPTTKPVTTPSSPTTKPVTTPASSSPAEPTTTHPPVTSSSKPPSTTSSTPIPVTPTPDIKKGSWNVTNSKNVTCIRIDGIFSIDYKYNINKTESKKAHFDVPHWAIANGTCEGKIELRWMNNSFWNSLEFIFKKSNDNKSYFLDAFHGQIFISSIHSNKTITFNTNNNEKHYETPVNQSYSCSSMRQIKVDDHATVTLDEFHLQAFKTSSVPNFDDSIDCSGNSHSTPDIVPIIVGCVLALLVIAVLVAYLISRRRSATRGYLSM